MKNNQNTDVLATKLLSDLGYPNNSIKGGSTRVLAALNELGVKPSETKLYGRGIQFFVSETDYKRLTEPKKQTKKPINQKYEGSIYFRHMRDQRTIARAVLHLYESLGEKLHPRSNLREIAEKDDDTGGAA